MGVEFILKVSTDHQSHHNVQMFTVFQLRMKKHCVFKSRIQGLSESQIATQTFLSFVELLKKTCSYDGKVDILFILYIWAIRYVYSPGY